jgi:hypothetical protein
MQKTNKAGIPEATAMLLKRAAEKLKPEPTKDKIDDKSHS